MLYTDGITDNMKPNEIETLINIQASNSASTIAEVLVDAARLRRSVDDDCTAIALKLGDGGWAGGDMSVQMTPSDKDAVAQAASRWFKKSFGEDDDDDDEFDDEEEDSGSAPKPSDGNPFGGFKNPFS